MKVIGDKERLKQVAYNLIVNAINKTCNGSVTVSVSYSFIKSLLKIEVRDTGMGMYEYTKNKLKILFNQKYDLNHRMID